MTITTKKTSNGATIYYADGKRVAKAVAIKTAKENNINIIDTTTVDTNDNAGAKVSYDETNKVQDYAEAIEILKQVIDLDTLEYTPDKFARFHNSYTAIRRSDGATVIVHEEMDYGIVWLINVIAEDRKDVDIYIKDAHAAAKAAEESAPPVADANRPVKTFATKEIKNKVYYYDKKTGKKISKAKALASTNLTALKEITAAFNRNGKTYDYYEDDLTVSVTVDSYEKAIDALNAAIMVITGKPADLSKAEQDTNGSISHYLGDGLTVSECVGSDNHLHIHIDWAQDGHNYNDLCCKYDFEGSYRIEVAPVHTAPEPNDNGGN